VEKEPNTMKFIRPFLIVAILSCVVAGAALADDIHVVFDPQIPQAGPFGIIQENGVNYTSSWESCGTIGIPSAFAADDACLAFINETGGDINALNFSFTVNSALVGQTIACDNLPGDPHLSSNTCGSVPTGPEGFTLGQVVSVTFFAGDPIPNDFAFFIGETGVALEDAPVVGIEVPEPTSMTLLASGMGLLALGMVFAKR
jgi:hypothetical protein